MARNPQESFGIALLEAQAAGLPIVASEWNGYPEVLPPFYGGRMVPTVASRAYARTLNWRHLSDAGAIDFTALVALLRRFLEEPALREEAARDGRQHAGQFTWRSTAERLVVLWEALVARHRDGPGEQVAAARAEGLTWRGAAGRLLARWGAGPRPSPVEGLATHYTEPALRFRVEPDTSAALRRREHSARARANCSPLTRDRSSRSPSGGATPRLSTTASDRLFLHLIRTGAVSAAQTPRMTLADSDP